MSTLDVPSAFAESYMNYETYPKNLIYKTTYPSELQRYRNRFEAISRKLCVDDEKAIEVGFRDFDANGKKYAKNLYEEARKIKLWLGDLSSNKPNTQRTIAQMVTKKDPRCRFIFLSGETNQSPLFVTKDILSQILCYHQVMPSFFDFISLFGRQGKKRDLRFGGFREQTFLNHGIQQQIKVQHSGGQPSANDQAQQAIQPGIQTPQPRLGAEVVLGPRIPSLGRSGQGYQLCYNLKCVVNKALDDNPAKNGDDGEKHWSIHQTAVHHQFDALEGTTLWITTSGSEDIQDAIEELTAKDGRPEDRAFSTVEESFRSSLSVHLLLCHWSTKGWRERLRWLEDVVEHQTDMAILGSHDPNEPGSPRRIYTSKDIQDIQFWEDRINEIAMVVESNNDVMASLRSFYEALLENSDFPLRDDCRSDVKAFATQVNIMIADLKMQAARAKLLARITSDRKSLVLQHLQSQATEKMEHLANESQREAIAMRVIAVVTMTFLPATFVSTFFSTDIVKWQNPQGGPPGDGNFSGRALWIWFLVAGGLTLITLALAAYWYKNADKKRRSWSLSWTKSINVPEFHEMGRIV